MKCSRITVCRARPNTAEKAKAGFANILLCVFPNGISCVKQMTYTLWYYVLTMSHIHFLCLIFISSVSYSFPLSHIHFLCLIFISSVSYSFPLSHIHFLCLIFISSVSYSFPLSHIHFLCLHVYCREKLRKLTR